MDTDQRLEESSAGAAPRRLEVGAWLMLPLLIPSMILAVLVTLVLLGTADLEGSEPMSEQGLVGWAAVALGLIIWPLPAYVGVWLGAKARSLGRGASATVATVLNGLAIAGIWTLTVATTLNQL